MAVLAGDEATVARVAGRRLVGTGWVSHVLQEAVAMLWADPGTGRRLRQAARVYAARRTALIDALGRHGIAAHGRSGMNVWVPVAAHEAGTVQAMLEAGWAVRAGSRYRPGVFGAAPAHTLTTKFAFLPQPSG